MAARLVNALGALALFVGPWLGLWGCTPDTAPERRDAAPLLFRYDGPGGVSEVQLERLPDGRELLRGRTELAPAAPAAARGEAGPEIFEERAALDRHGQLEELEVARSGAGNGARYTLAPREGLVRIEEGGARAREWRVAGDAPWLYAPAEQGGAVRFTPVAAWVALRAASGASVVRVLVPELRESHLMAADQVTVATEGGRTLALGFGADADAEFLAELRWSEGRVALRRVAGPAGPQAQRDAPPEPHSS